MDFLDFHGLESPSQAASMASEAHQECPAAEALSVRSSVEFTPGSLPLILSVPHDGNLRPFASRRTGCLCEDAGTASLARSIRRSIAASTGGRANAAMVLSRIHRSCMDPNRVLSTAVGPDAPDAASKAWHEYHIKLKHALRQAVSEHGFALLVDVHGQDHRADATELGYMLSSLDLLLSDAELAARVPESSLRNLSTASFPPSKAHESIRGASSFGAMLEKRGWAATPSPRIPSPVSKEAMVGALSAELDQEIIRGGDLSTLLLRHGFAASERAALEVKAHLLRGLGGAQALCGGGTGRSAGSSADHTDHRKGIYFWGGFTLQAYSCPGAVDADLSPITAEDQWWVKSVSAIQLEACKAVRTPVGEGGQEQRDKFGAAVADALLEFLAVHYDYHFSSSSRCEAPLV